jgi:hypothetical protein
VSLRDVRERCSRILDECSVPRPFELDTFRRVVEQRRGRRITLVPRDHMVGPCGVLISLQDADYVFYEAVTSPVHRDHIIVHELGHLLCDHVPQERIGDDVVRFLLPDLDPGMVRRALGRTAYGQVEEQEAEMVASLVLGRPRVERAPTDPLMDRLQRSLGASRD